MRKIGFIVNPIAGMGGSVGLKGTDDNLYLKALELGANPVSPLRAMDFLKNITYSEKILFLCAPGKMGADYLQQFGFNYQVVGNISMETSAQDTLDISLQISQEGAELIVFFGGDGTARDIFDALGKEITVIAVPSGVKIYSGVFATSVIAAVHLLEAYLEGSLLSEEEVLDINEEAYRNNRLDSQLYGYLKVPKLSNYLQHSKAASSSEESNLLNQEDAAEWFIEKMEDDVLYFLGPGSTIEAVTNSLRLEKTLLGIDALLNHKLIQKDLNEKSLLDLITKFEKRKIVLTPIGGNGYIFGRGSKQFTPEVIQKVGKENIIVLATREKLENLKVLRVDSGDQKTDQYLQGYIEVINGYRESRMVKIICDS